MWISLMEFEKKLPFKVRPHNRKQLSLQCKMIGAPSFFTTLLVDATTPTIPTNNPFLYTSAIFHRLIFTHSHPYNPYQKFFPLPQPFSQFRLSRRPNEQVGLVWTGIVSISPYLPEAWAEIIALTIIDFLSVILSKFVYCG